jgi:hypothetical protein
VSNDKYPYTFKTTAQERTELRDRIGANSPVSRILDDYEHLQHEYEELQNANTQLMIRNGRLRRHISKCDMLAEGASIGDEMHHEILMMLTAIDGAFPDGQSNLHDLYLEEVPTALWSSWSAWRAAATFLRRFIVLPKVDAVDIDLPYYEGDGTPAPMEKYLEQLGWAKGVAEAMGNSLDGMKISLSVPGGDGREETAATLTYKEPAVEPVCNAVPVSQTARDLCRMLIERDALGQKKYGTSLDREDLKASDWEMHKLEEILDSAGYALRAYQKRKRLEAAVSSFLGAYGAFVGHKWSVPSQAWEEARDRVEDAISALRKEYEAE